MNIPPVLDSTQTVQRFLTGQSIESQNIGDSYAALRAKASSLFERASRLAASWNPGKDFIFSIDSLEQILMSPKYLHKYRLVLQSKVICRDYQVPSLILQGDWFPWIG